MLTENHGRNTDLSLCFLQYYRNYFDASLSNVITLVYKTNFTRVVSHLQTKIRFE